MAELNLIYWTQVAMEQHPGATANQILMIALDYMELAGEIPPETI